MKIYKNIQRFDAQTGKPYFIKKFAEFRCDFSGTVIDEDDLENLFYPSYDLEYGDSDPCFGSDGEEYKFGKRNNIPMFEFLIETYHFRNDQDQDQSVAMMVHYLPKKMTFAQMCRTSRIVTAQKLIDSNKITPEQLYRD